MIYTCTLNPSIDYVVKVSDFKEGAVNRSEAAFTYPGGKGINVSRVLKRMGAESMALGFTGGFTGSFIKDFLASESILHDFIEVPGLTRINVKLKSQTETEINGRGPAIQLQQQKKLEEKIAAMNEGDILVLAGSVPGSIGQDFYASLAEKCLHRGVRVVIDTTGDPLVKTFPYSPFLIKPNHHELGELFQKQIEDVEDAVFYGKKLLEEGVQNVIVSMADKGAVFLNKELALLANVPNGIVKNSVGAGDSVVAGFLSQIVQSKDLLTAFQYGVASGSATAFSEDLCTREHVESLLKEIHVRKVDV